MCKVHICEGLEMQLRLGCFELVEEEEPLALSIRHSLRTCCSLALVLCSEGLRAAWCATGHVALKREREFG